MVRDPMMAPACVMAIVTVGEFSGSPDTWTGDAIAAKPKSSTFTSPVGAVPGNQKVCGSGTILPLVPANITALFGSDGLILSAMKKSRSGVAVVVSSACGRSVRDRQSHDDQNRVVLLAAAIHGGHDCSRSHGKALGGNVRG